MLRLDAIVSETKNKNASIRWETPPYVLVALLFIVHGVLQSS